MDRLQLQSSLETLLGTCNVYFQPPPTVQLSYPCIIYERAPNLDLPADDIRYIRHLAYRVIAIDRNPDTTLPDKLVDAFPYARFDRYYAADNLNHYSITLYI